MDYERPVHAEWNVVGDGTFASDLAAVFGSQITCAAKNRKKGTQSKWNDEKIRRFLSEFKTKPCTLDRHDFHDRRMCPGYHNSEDKRRDPYHKFYDLDECITRVEKMYHPVIFHTTLCNRLPGCDFGDACAHAHSEVDVRNRTSCRVAYEAHDFKADVAGKKYAPVTLSTFVRKPAPRRDYLCECRELWSALQTKPTTDRFALSKLQHFLISRSPSLLHDIEDAACEEGLCTVQLQTSGSKSRVILQGLHVPCAAKRMVELLKPPSKHFIKFRKEYGARVIAKLKQEAGVDGLGEPSELFKSPDLMVEFDGDSVLILWAVTSKHRNANRLIENVTEKIDYWTKQEEYDKFVECCCCCDKYNTDQGVSCPNGHFFCAVEGCLDGAIESQLQVLSAKADGNLQCHMCSSPYELRTIAPHLSSDLYEKVQTTLVDRKVKDHREKMEEEFNARLDEKVKEVMEKYGDADERLRMQAQTHAQEIRNTIINLACPHCKTVYFDFTGCMALKCSICEGNFCGYCHEKTGTSQGAHQHVRMCLMNATANGSYYANPDEVKEAQKRYRIRELKKTLRQHKKDLQNAIVIELERELRDLDINSGALFEFGNLHGDLF